MAGQDVSGIGSILERLRDLAGKEREVSVNDVIEAFGRRSYGPLLAVPALLGASPVGAIPGAPTLLAIVVFLFAIQIVFGAKGFWLPGILRDRRVPSSRLKSAAEKMEPVAERLDRWFGHRLGALTKGPFIRVAALACLLLALLVPPLELVPFAAAVPFIAIAFFGIALSVKDGLLMVFAMVLAAGAIGFAIVMMPGDAFEAISSWWN